MLLPAPVELAPVASGGRCVLGTFFFDPSMLGLEGKEPATGSSDYYSHSRRSLPESLTKAKV